MEERHQKELEEMKRKLEDLEKQIGNNYVIGQNRD